MWKRLKKLLARLWREHTTPGRLGLAVGLGVFIGCSPFYGLHVWIGLAVALALRLNKLAIFLGSQISIPPLAPLIVYACVQLGSLFIRGEPLQITMEDLSGLGFVELAQTFFLDWLAGWPVVGTTLAAAFALLTAWYVRRRRRRSEDEPADHEAEADAAWEELLDQLSERYRAAPARHRRYVYFKVRMDPAYRQVCDLLAGVERVVDLGTGQGVMPVLLALGARKTGMENKEQGTMNEEWEGRRFIGVEWDEAKVAAGRVAAAGLDEVSLVQEDIRQYALPGADAVVLLDVLHYYPVNEQRRMIRRAVRALEPGGRLVIRETDRARRWLLTRLLEWVAMRARWNRGPGLCYRTVQELRADLEAQKLRCQQSPASSSVHRGNILVWGEKQ